jgi:hypothetical protein
MNIALMGRARSGKDTVAARLVTAHRYTRVAFADPLKDVALSLDPLIDDEWRLSDCVKAVGWEQAKEDPEVRRTLQRLGQGIRDRDPGFWLRLALAKVSQCSTPIVVTDVRYPNEYSALQARGFLMVRVARPNYPAETVTSEELTNRRHTSETALDGYLPDVVLSNAGTLNDLTALADSLV